MASIGLSASWLAQVGDEFERDYMVNLKQSCSQSVRQERRSSPRDLEYFAALNAVAMNVRVVILGQDPITDLGRPRA